MAGKSASIVDLGGGSVQQAYATTVATPEGKAAEYVLPISAMGQEYQVYVHRCAGRGCDQGEGGGAGLGGIGALLAVQASVGLSLMRP